MASLTPGVLLKLLQSMDSDTKVTGEHRSAVLQVIGIVPALTASTADDLWPSHGFYLQLSDAIHSTYVSLSDHEADTILLNKPQLGQFVHVDRLISSHPVPRAAGLRPVPCSRPHPFIGSPEPLVALSSPSKSGFIIQPASPSHPAPPLLPSSSKRTVLASKENVITPVTGTVRRRASSPGPAKLRNSNSNSNSNSSSRPASPAVRSASPVPSKCTVPSLLVAKEENRRVSKEPAIVVPSRYRQPSPVGRRGAASPAARRTSVSPGRRLSSGFKMSPAAAAGDGGGGSKKRVGVVVAGISKVSDALLGSAKSVRKSWDDSSIGSVVSLEGKEKGGGRRSKVDSDAILRTQVAISRRLSDASNEQSGSEEGSTVDKPKFSRKSDSNSSEKIKPTATKITIHDRKWTDGSIPLDALSDNLAKLGKDAIQRRDLACTVAMESLQEALVTEALIRNLSKFSDLRSSSETTNPLPTIDQFLTVYTDLLKWRKTVESLTSSKFTSNGPLSDMSSLEKSASLWVESALSTNLEITHLLNNTVDPSLSKKNKSSDKSVPGPTFPKKQQQSLASTTTKGQHSRVFPVPSQLTNNNSWNKNHGLTETLDLAKGLQKEMQVWFLKFVDEALDLGFVLIGKEGNNGNNGKVTAVLSQFKRINDWLDGVGKVPEEEGLRERIERLKRKIYGFVISRVGSALDSSVSISKS